MVLVIQRQVKDLSHRLLSSIPKDLTLSEPTVPVVMIAGIGCMLLFSSIVMRYYGPDLVIMVISWTGLTPSILPLLLLISFTRDWLLSDEPTKRTDLNDGLPYDPTLPHRRWHPKISPYRFTVFLTPLAIGTVNAVLSLTESITTLITIVIFVV